jgi:hypothetical protein
MTRAHSSQGLCDPSANRIDAFLDGNVNGTSIKVHLLVDRASGPVRGIFAVTFPDQTPAIGSMAARYLIGNDLISGNVDSDLASGLVGAPAGHAFGTWQCHG